MTPRRMAATLAAKIVAAVNALHKVADLVDAIDNLRIDSESRSFAAMYRARAALLAALGVTDA